MSKDSIGIQEIIHAVAFRDGCLRDVYIFDTSLEDWDKLLSLLKKEYTLESEEFIPNSISEIIPIRQERGFLLRVRLLEGLTANCHFYVCESEFSPIEFDFDPREMQSPDSMIKALQFMSKIGDGLNKDVFLTEENSETSVLLSYSSKNKIYYCFLQDHCYFNALQMGQLSDLWPRAEQYSRPK
jgi:hypothetical protein